MTSLSRIVSFALLPAAFEADAACTVANPNANVAEATPTSAFTDHDDGTVTHIKYLQLPCRWLCAAFAFFVIFAFSEAFAATGPNLITNGNFESGDTGFLSDYSNVCPTDINAGCYEVVNNANVAHSAWVGLGYGGSGNFFVANGSANTANSVWKTSSTIAVTQANTNYRFSARLATVYPVSADGGGVGGTNGPKLSFQIGDGTNWVTIGATTAFGTDAVVGDWIQVTIDGKFTATGNYHIRLKNDQTAAAGNDFGLDEVEFYLYSDVTDSTTFNTTGLTGADPDTTAPTLLSTTPSDNATGVAVGSNITLTFDESVNTGTGSINIYKTSGGALVESIDVTSLQVTGSGGATITVNPGSDLTANTEYYILIDATAFDDPAGNSYAGIADTTALSFTTVDTTPTAFTFTAQTGAALSSVATSNTVTVAGINSAASISIAGGTYKINSGSYTSSAGTVNNGDEVTVQQTSSGSFSTLTTATLTIGGVAGAFEVTTLAQDTTPDAFSFTAQTGAALSSVATSNTLTVAGINSAANISIVGGTYSVNGGAYTAVAGTVNNGDTVTVQQTSSGSFSTLTTATLTIGGVDGAFEVTTLAQDTTPDAFSFTAQTGAALSSVATSNTITVAGINSAASISIAGGEYAVSTDSGANWSAWSDASPATVGLNDQVKVRQTSSASFSTLTTATLTIGGVDGAFNVTTVAAPVVASPVNGVCGTANGVAASSAPSANRCATGPSSAVAGSGPWTWSCYGSDGGSDASCSAPLALLDQTIGFGAAPSVVVGGTGTVSATATSGLAVTFSSTTTGICTVSGSTVTGVAAGTCTIAADQAGDATYNAAPQVTQNITVGKNSQTISFGAAPTVAVGVTGTATATATSGLAVSFTSTTTGICTVSGSTVTGVAAGTCTIAANQAGNASYNPAPQVTQNITVTQAPVNGACGSANGVATAFVPSANLCEADTASAVAVGSPWTWSCNGSSGGTNANCSAPNQPTGGGSGRAVISGSTWVVDPALSSGFIAASGDPSGKSPPNLPPGVSFPYGLFDFTLITGAAGSAATITITYPAALPAGAVYWKYGPSPDGYNCSGAACAAAHWYQMPPAQAVFAGNTVTLTIVDGGVGDDDLAANSVIVDQGGPGVPFSTASIPTLSEWALLALAGLMGLFGMGTLWRRAVL